MIGYFPNLVILYQFQKKKIRKNNSFVKVRTLLHCMLNEILTNQSERLLKGIHVYLEQFG